MDYLLDLRTLRCPLPLLTAKKAFAALAEGDSLCLQLAAYSVDEDFVTLGSRYACQLKWQKILEKDEREMLFSKKHGVSLSLKGDL